MSSFGQDNHFDRSRRTKECVQSVNRLRKWAATLSRASDEDHKSFAQVMFDAAVQVEARQELFEESKSNYKNAILGVSSFLRANVLTKMAQDVVANLVSRETPKLSDDALKDPESAVALYERLRKDSQEDGIGMRLVED